MNFNANVKPEDKITVLDTLSEAPKNKDRNYAVGDEVAVIKSDGRFEIAGKITEIGGKIIFAETFNRGHKQGKIWMLADNKATDVQSDIPTAPKGYRVQIGSGKFTEYLWFPPEQIFPAPWANNVNLKVGDTIFQRKFGNFESSKGTITELPSFKGGSFRVKFDSYDRDEAVDPHDVFSVIEPAALEKLAVGDIVYFDRMYWVMVVGKKDDDRVVIREVGFNGKDKIVHISKLQILR